jgi:hypothetical protein
MERQTDAYYADLTKQLAAARSKQQLFETVVNAPFGNKVESTHMYLGIIVLLVASKKDGLIHRLALSDTELAKGTTEISVKKFEEIKIPLNAQDNIIADTIRTGKPHSTTDWYHLFTPALEPEQARLNQAGGAIAFSAVYPLIGQHDRGALIFSYYQYIDKIGDEQNNFMAFYSQTAQKYLAKYM